MLTAQDCTDQGLYNLLVYHRWTSYLPHTRKLVVPMEAGALSYTLGHKEGVPAVDADGRIRDYTRAYVPPVVHQFAKGRAGKALRRTRFATFLSELANASSYERGRGARGRMAPLGCDECLMADGSASSARLASYCARRCSWT